MPGLVNAHTHLDDTLYYRGFASKDVPFFPWIRTLNGTKARVTKSDWAVSSLLGATECLASGTTTIGDNADAPTATAAAICQAGLRAVIYQEIFGIDERQTIEEIISSLLSTIDANRIAGGPRVSVGISPHALYTVRPELFKP